MLAALALMLAIAVVLVVVWLAGTWRSARLVTPVDGLAGVALESAPAAHLPRRQREEGPLA
ncbi:MAG: hypothetical protein WD226_04975 [Planctomycetota bacterium]